MEEEEQRNKRKEEEEEKRKKERKRKKIEKNHEKCPKILGINFELKGHARG